VNRVARLDRLLFRILRFVAVWIANREKGRGVLVMDQIEPKHSWISVMLGPPAGSLPSQSIHLDSPRVGMVPFEMHSGPFSYIEAEPMPEERVEKVAEETPPSDAWVKLIEDLRENGI